MKQEKMKLKKKKRKKKRKIKNLDDHCHTDKIPSSSEEGIEFEEYYGYCILYCSTLWKTLCVWLLNSFHTLKEYCYVHKNRNSIVAIIPVLLYGDK